MKTDGVIERVAIKDINTKNGMQKKTSIMLNNKWYSVWGVLECNKGDFIDFEYEVNNTFNNIKKIIALEPNIKDGYDAPPKEEDITEHNTVSNYDKTQQLILKQVALKCAVEHNKNHPKDMDIVITDAKVFYNWLREHD